MIRKEVPFNRIRLIFLLRDFFLSTTNRPSFVFIHGLTGDRETTWAHENGNFWPTKLSWSLPEHNFVTYGYNIGIFKLGSGNNSDLFYDLGQSLASAVIAFKQSTPSRPTIFIAHGFGGLLVQAALLLSRDNDQFADLLRNTVGIFFIGTPQSSDSIKSLGRIIPNLYKCGSESTETSLDPLDVNLDVLGSVSESFRQMLLNEGINIRIFCFYETVEVEGIGLILPKEAAVIDNYDNAPLAFNHIEMTKFSSERTGAYRFMLERLHIWCWDLTLELMRKENGAMIVLGEKWRERERAHRYGTLTKRGNFIEAEREPHVSHHEGGYDSMGIGGGCA